VIPVAIYCRVSDPAQERGTSLENQKQRCIAYCERMGYIVVVVIFELEGGEFINARTKYHDLLAREDIERIVVDIPDRLGRGETRGILEYIAKREGKTIEFATPQPDQTTVAGLAAKMAQDLVSGVERLNIRKRLMDGRNNRARQGRIIAGARAPFGYRYVTERDHRGRVLSCKLEIDYDKIVIYHLIVEWLLRGIPEEGIAPMSVRGICRRLSFQGIETPSPKSSEWSIQTVKKILHNPVYCGRWEYGRNIWLLEDRVGGAKARIIGRRSDEETIAVSTPAAVDLATWQAIQDRLASNKENKFHPPTKREYLLRGMVTCAKCNHKMIGEGGRSGNGAILTYYSCHQRRHKAIDPCKAKRIRTHAVEDAAWDAIKELCIHDSVVEAAKKESKQRRKIDNYAESIKAQEKIIKDGKRELRDLLTLKLKGEKSAPTLSVYLEAEKDIGKRIAAAEKVLAQIKATRDRAKEQIETDKALSELKREMAEKMNAATDYTRRRMVLEQLSVRCVCDTNERKLLVDCVFGSLTVDI